MRIVSYNILDGGEGRADPIAEVIEAQRPDVVALVEADLGEVVERIANRLKMDFVHAPGNSKASALLSRWPIVQTINHAVMHKQLAKSFLEAVVRTPSGLDIPVGVLHLTAHAREADETQREQELDLILRLTDPHRQAGRAHLLCGDFNANSPIQQIDPDRVKPRTREEWEANGRQIPRWVIQKLLGAGYVDTLAAAVGESAATACSFTTQHPGQRVDYIFAWQPAPITSAWIEQDRLAKYASDHYPVGAELGF